MKRTILTLLISERCSAKCAICVASCSPEQTNRMDDGIMFRAIDMAVETDIFKGIAFSGGEPFLFLDMLETGLKRVKAAGLKTLVYTNGFWGGWTDFELEEKVAGLPIDCLIISTDAYHSAHIPIEHVNHAAVFSIKHYKKTVLRIGETKQGLSAWEHFDRLGNVKYMVDLVFYPFAREGRAEAFPDDVFYRTFSCKDAYCVSEEIAVRYNGDVFLCSERAFSGQAASMGNLTNYSLSDILSKEYNKRQIDAVSTYASFSGMISEAKAKGIVLPECATNGCEYCRLIPETEGAEL